VLLAAVRRAVPADWISLNNINPDPESLSMRRGAPNRDCCRTNAAARAAAPMRRAGAIPIVRQRRQAHRTGAIAASKEWRDARRPGTKAVAERGGWASRQHPCHLSTEFAPNAYLSGRGGPVRAGRRLFSQGIHGWRKIACQLSAITGVRPAEPPLSNV
jgi:hypothetical protein